MAIDRDGLSLALNIDERSVNPVDLKAITSVITLLTTGGPSAIIAILVRIIATLLYDRRRLISDIDKAHTKVDRFVEDYHQGTLTLSDAFTSIEVISMPYRGCRLRLEHPHVVPDLVPQVAQGRIRAHPSSPASCAADHQLQARPATARERERIYRRVLSGWK